jgi:hypothetical protein
MRNWILSAAAVVALLVTTGTQANAQVVVAGYYGPGYTTYYGPSYHYGYPYGYTSYGYYPYYGGYYSSYYYPRRGLFGWRRW